MDDVGGNLCLDDTGKNMDRRQRNRNDHHMSLQGSFDVVSYHRYQ